MNLSTLPIKTLGQDGAIAPEFFGLGGLSGAAELHTMEVL